MSVNSVTSYIPTFQNSSMSSLPKTVKEDTVQQSSLGAISTKWGFKVDEQGFFGADFNKATGIPEKVKIHQTMMDTAQEYSTARKDGTDPLSVVSKVWKLYETVTGKTLDPDNDGLMSPEDIEKMPQSYLSKGSLLDGIVSINKTPEEGIILIPNTFVRAYDTGFRDLGSYGSGTNEEIVKNGRNEYMNYTGILNDTLPKDKFSVGELFGNFFYTSVQNETEAYTQGQEGYVERTKKHFELLEQGNDAMSYLENMYGSTHIKAILQGAGTQENGDFSQKLVDNFLAEFDQSLKNQQNQYKTHDYQQLDPSLHKDTTEEATRKNGYISTKNTPSLPNGSVMSVAT